MIKEVDQDDQEIDEEIKRKGSVDLMGGAESKNSQGENKLQYSRDSYKEFRKKKTNSLSYSDHFEPHLF